MFVPYHKDLEKHRAMAAPSTIHNTTSTDVPQTDHAPVDKRSAADEQELDAMEARYRSACAMLHAVPPSREDLWLKILAKRAKMRAYDEELAAKLAKADDQDQVKASIEPEHSAFTGGAEEPCKAEEVLKTPTGWSSGANAVRAARPLRRSSGAERSKTVYLSSEATPLQALRSESSEEPPLRVATSGEAVSSSSSQKTMYVHSEDAPPQAAPYSSSFIAKNDEDAPVGASDIFLRRLTDPAQRAFMQQMRRADDLPADGAVRQRGSNAELRRNAQDHVLLDVWSFYFPADHLPPTQTATWVNEVAKRLDDGQEGQHTLAVLFGALALETAHIDHPRAYLTSALHNATRFDEGPMPTKNAKMRQHRQRKTAKAKQAEQEA